MWLIIDSLTKFDVLIQDVPCYSGCGFILPWTLVQEQCPVNVAVIFWGSSEPEVQPLLCDKRLGQMLIAPRCAAHVPRRCVSEVVQSSSAG